MQHFFIISFFIYYVCLLCVALACYRRAKTSAGFLLGNRSIMYWVGAIAAHATDASAWLLMGYPAYIYGQGLFQVWIGIGLTVGAWLSWTFVAPALRSATERYNAVSIANYVERRFDDEYGFVGIVFGCISVVFFIFYIAVGLVASGYLFQSIFHAPYEIGAVLGLVAALGYTMIGGFLAVVWNDFFQGIFLLIMLLLVPTYAIYHAGGVVPIIDAVYFKHGTLSLFPTVMSYPFLQILNSVAWGLGWFGVPHIIVNFMGIDDVRKMKRARFVGIMWSIFAYIGATLVGLVGVWYFPTGIVNQELIFITMAQLLLHPLLAGFALCAVIAATLSTLDTQLLLAATTCAETLYKNILRKEVPPGHLVLMTRISLLFIAIAALILSVYGRHSILWLVDYAWAGLGASFGPLILFSLYSTRVNKYGALAGMISGAIVAGSWQFVYAGPYIYQMIPAFIVSSVMIYVVSLITGTYHR